MKIKVILASAIATVFVLGALAPAAKALDIPVGVEETGANLGNNTSVAIESDDASGGIKTRSNTHVSANAGADAEATTQERARIYDESDSRFNSGVSSRVNADTSAGADENADLRAQIRNAPEDGDRTSTNATTEASTGVSANTGLFGLSVGANSRTGVGLYNE